MLEAHDVAVQDQRDRDGRGSVSRQIGTGAGKPRAPEAGGPLTGRILPRRGAQTGHKKTPEGTADP